MLLDVAKLRGWRLHDRFGSTAHPDTVAWCPRHAKHTKQIEPTSKSTQQLQSVWRHAKQADQIEQTTKQTQNKRRYDRDRGRYEEEVGNNTRPMPMGSRRFAHEWLFALHRAGDPRCSVQTAARSSV